MVLSLSSKELNYLKYLYTILMVLENQMESFINIHVYSFKNMSQ